jgi:eukaryotic-like serine/threonine-protein kinase
MTQVGQYRLLDKLGSSVLGAVYQAQDMATGSTVALKVLQLGMLDDISSADMDTRLQREFAAVARLIHPGIARVYDIRRDGKTALIAEELVDGPSITAFAAAQGGFDVTQAVTAAVQILEALEFRAPPTRDSSGFETVECPGEPQLPYQDHRLRHG